MGSKSNRNYTLDLIKLIAACFVVFIHVPFYGKVGEAVSLIARFAVPVFFMTSGFFSYGNDNKVLLRKIKKLVFILIFASCLYNVSNIALEYLSGGADAVAEYFSAFTKVKGWLLLLFFNVPFSATRLWFLFALIYVYFMQMAFNKLEFGKKWIFAVSVSGIALHFLVGSIMPQFGINTEEYMCRNFLLLGYPFYGFGFLLRGNPNVFKKCSDSMLVVAFALGGLLSLVPLFYKSVAVLSVGTLLLVLALFEFARRKSQVQYPKWVKKFCDCSLGIYILHRPITQALHKMLTIASLADNLAVTKVILPFLVCIVSALVTLLLLKLSRKRAE